jgi:hypothetical protein
MRLIFLPYATGAIVFAVSPEKQTTVFHCLRASSEQSEQVVQKEGFESLVYGVRISIHKYGNSQSATKQWRQDSGI